MVNLPNNEVNVAFEEFNVSSEIGVLTRSVAIRASKTLQKFKSLITHTLSFVKLAQLEKVVCN